MSHPLTRRDFIGGAVAAASALPAVAAEGPLAKRALGKTGQQVTLLALGCGSRLLSYKDQDVAVETIEKALAGGIRYLDTAQNYGNGRSETWVGQVMKTRRNEVFLATKTQARTYDDVMTRIEESLKRLNTDHVDLLHFHSLQGMDDVEAIADNKAIDAMYRIRDEGMARFIGVTSHTDPEALAAALERYDFNCTQMALNAALQGMQNGQGKMILNPAMPTSFEDVALPVARKKKLGVLAMKAFGQEDLLPDPNDHAHAARLLRYSLSLEGVSAAVVGCPQHTHLQQNLATARSFKPMPANERKSFSGEMSERYKQALDLKFQSHVDA